MPSLRSSIAAASPDGPPPTITGPSAVAIVILHQPGDLGAAEEALAAAHQGAGAAAKPIGVNRGDRSAQCVTDLAVSDALAEADDSAVVGVARDPLRLLVGTRPELADVRHPQAARLGPGGELEPAIDERLAHPLGDRQRRRDAGRADSARAELVLGGVR